MSTSEWTTIAGGDGSDEEYEYGEYEHGGVEGAEAEQDEFGFEDSNGRSGFLGFSIPFIPGTEGEGDDQDEEWEDEEIDDEGNLDLYGDGYEDEDDGEDNYENPVNPRALMYAANAKTTSNSSGKKRSERAGTDNPYSAYVDSLKPLAHDSNGNAQNLGQRKRQRSSPTYDDEGSRGSADKQGNRPHTPAEKGKGKAKGKGKEKVGGGVGGGGQVLPVAQLPVDWDWSTSVPTDGSQFLAMMRHQEKDLPFQTTAKFVPRGERGHEGGSRVLVQESLSDSGSEDGVVIRQEHEGSDMELDEEEAMNSEPPQLIQNAQAGPYRPISTGTASAPLPNPVESRHPALPTESWRSAFTSHFLGYRKALTSEPAVVGGRKQAQIQTGRELSEKAKKDALSRLEVKPPLGSRSKAQWWTFIHGVKRKKMHITEAARRKMEEQQQEEWRVDAALKTAGDASTVTENEEALPNERSTEVPNPASKSESGKEAAHEQEDPEKDDDDDSDSVEESDEGEASVQPVSKFVLEPELPKHSGAEPLVSILRLFSVDDVHFLLECLTEWVEHNLALAADPPYLVSTCDDAPQTFSLPPNINPQVIETPLLPIHSRWIFSLLLRVDAQLLGSDVSDLRELAKICMNVVRWQVYAGKLVPPKEKSGVATANVPQEQEEMRMSCWMIHQAVASGWGQTDLIMDAETIFKELPLSGFE